MIERDVTATISAVGLLGATDLDVNVSVYPTAIGHMTNQEETVHTAMTVVH